MGVTSVNNLGLPRVYSRIREKFDFESASFISLSFRDLNKVSNERMIYNEYNK